jgi:hypothetical protein
VVLESALETSRVVADLLVTLGVLGRKSSKDGATLRGRIASTATPGLEKIGAKVLIEGTSYSTLATPEGAYEFRGLPAGTIRLVILRAGSETAVEEIALEKNGTVVKDLRLRATAVAGDLVRNADLRVHWVQKAAPDGWTRSKDAWEGEAIPVKPGRKLRLRVEWKPGATGEVVVRWREHSAPQGGHPTETEPLRPGSESALLTAPDMMNFARLIVRGSAPDACLARVSLATEE